MKRSRFKSVKRNARNEEMCVNGEYRLIDFTCKDFLFTESVRFEPSFNGECFFFPRPSNSALKALSLAGKRRIVGA